MRLSEDNGVRELWRLVREDWEMHGRSWIQPGFHVLAVYRFGVWLDVLPAPWWRLARFLHAVMYVFVMNVYGAALPRGARIGRRLLLPHPVGVVLSRRVIIGDDCVIRQNVTLGAVSNDQRGAPRVGNRVEFGAGAVVVGAARIGDDVRIGPNAVVIADVEAGSTVFAPPAKALILRADQSSHDRHPA